MQIRNSIIVALLALFAVNVNAGLFQLQKGEFTTETTLTNQANSDVYIDNILIFVQATITAEVKASLIDKDDNEAVIAATEGSVASFDSLLVTYEDGVQWKQGERLKLETTGAGDHQFRITIDYPE